MTLVAAYQAPLLPVGSMDGIFNIQKLLSHGSSAIVDPRGTIVKAARELSENLLVAEI